MAADPLLSIAFIWSTGAGGVPFSTHYKHMESSSSSASSPFSFEILPNGVKHSVLEKFPYRQMAVFEECSRSAHLVCQNSDLRSCFNVYEINVKEEGLFAKMEEHGQEFNIPYEAKVKLFTENMEIEIPPSAELLSSLSGMIGKVHILHCPSPTCSPAIFNDFLKTLKISSTLHMILNEDQEDFPYDTGNIPIVGIDNTCALSVKTMLSIKTRILVCSFEPGENELVSHIQSWQNGGETSTKMLIMEDHSILTTLEPLLLHLDPPPKEFSFDEVLIKWAARAVHCGNVEKCWVVERDSVRDPLLFVIIATNEDNAALVLRKASESDEDVLKYLGRCTKCYREKGQQPHVCRRS